MMPKILTKNGFVFLLILIFAFSMRFIGINWDDGTHLHPDERFLTMVGLDLKIPSSFAEYMHPIKSPLNPVNILDGQGSRKYPFFVYGTFPITLNKIVSVISNSNTYNGFTITGRMLSVFADLLVVVLIYKTVQLFDQQYHFDKSIKLWAAFFYSITVLPIQLSHFFAVDTFLNLFIFAVFYYTLRYYFKGETSSIILSGLFLGLGIASKITAIFIIPLVFLLILMAGKRKGSLDKSSSNNYLFSKRILISKLSILALFFLVVYFSLRIANPYMFEQQSLLNPNLSQLLVHNWKTLQYWSSKDVWYPPGVQWHNKPPIIFALFNIALFGVGLPYFLLCLLGIFLLFRKKHLPLTASFVWLILFFLYQSMQFAKSMRYFILLYPLMAFYAALGITYIKKRSKLLAAFFTITTLIWPLAFISIYLHPHSRIQASNWIFANIPAGKTIAWEIWDDPLPLRLPSGIGKNYNFLELPVFDYDTPEKWDKMNDSLAKTDYYILSSNRAWGSIPTVPEKYPRMSQFYKDLFSGKLNFKKVKEFTSYPSLSYLGLPLTFPDDIAEEAFTVYDHPQVFIFKKVYENYQ